MRDREASYRALEEGLLDPMTALPEKGGDSPKKARGRTSRTEEKVSPAIFDWRYPTIAFTTTVLELIIGHRGTPLAQLILQGVLTVAATAPIFAYMQTGKGKWFYWSCQLGASMLFGQLAASAVLIMLGLDHV